MRFLFLLHLHLEFITVLIKDGVPLYSLMLHCNNEGHINSDTLLNTKLRQHSQPLSIEDSTPSLHLPLSLDIVDPASQG